VKVIGLGVDILN